MPDLEFAHAATPGFSLENSLLSEFRQPVSSRPPVPGRTGSLKPPSGGIWLFALADAGHTVEDHTFEDLIREFRATPAYESAGINFSRLFRDARLPSGHSAAPRSGIVACGMCFDRVVVAHSGGSGCYVVRQNHATRLTLSNVDLIDYQVKAGDVLLLCGEALHQSVKGSEMASIAGHRADLRTATLRLLDLATQREPHQPMSVGAIRILAVERIGHRRARAYVSR